MGMASNYDPNAPLYLDAIETVDLTTEEFANSIKSFSERNLYMTGGNFIKFEKKKRTKNFFPILMTDSVYEGFKNANPTRKDIRENYWKQETDSIKNVTQKVFGGNVIWTI